MRPPPVALVLGGAFAFFLSFYLLMAALPLYARDLGVSDRSIGLVIGCFAVAAMVLRPWAGWAADRYGRRPIMLAGALVFLAAALAYGWAAGAVSLLLVRLFHGAGMGLYPTAASALVADVAPPERRGELLGLFGAANSVAMALGPLTGMAVAVRAGWPALFALSAAAALAGVALTALTGETLGERRRVVLRPSAALSRAAVFPSLVVMCLMLGYGAQVSFLPLHVAAQGHNPGLFFLFFALVVAVVRGKAGQLSDRLGRAPVAAAGLLFAGAGLVALALGRGAPGLGAAGVLYGVGFGAAQPALIAWCVDGAGPADRGRAMGTYYTALELGIAVGAMSSGLAVAALGFVPTFLGAAA
ncbi:MAG TPA: MFS transporter, partial [Methylomirabilota bacterium]|nr:MFS transporter [Methylomirabilota bacterium]